MLRFSLILSSKESINSRRRKFEPRVFPLSNLELPCRQNKEVEYKCRNSQLHSTVPFRSLIPSPFHSTIFVSRCASGFSYSRFSLSRRPPLPRTMKERRYGFSIKIFNIQKQMNQNKREEVPYSSKLFIIYYIFIQEAPIADSDGASNDQEVNNISK